MALRLEIENETNLPDGGPVTFTIAGKRTIDIGRDQHLDWTLPDPSRFISGKHCEVRYKDGGYWLHDVSTNGTYLNGAEERMRGPHRLKSGDRFIIGQYIIAAALDSDALDAEAASSASKVAANASASDGELWGSESAVAPPIDPKQLRAPSEVARPANAEFLDWAASVPHAEPFNSSNASAFTKQTSHEARPAEDTWWTDSAPPREYSITPAAPSLPPPQTPSLPQAAPAESPRHPAARSDASAERASWNNQDESPEPVHTSPFLSPARAKTPQRPVAPPPGPASQPARPALIDGAEADDAFLRMFAAAAGLPADIFAGADRREVAQQLGMALRLAVEGVMQLLKARSQAKQITRSTSQTMIEATGNNPLKFSPTPEDALRIMFGGKSRSYLDAQAALAQTFDDLKSHQLKTYAALQHAVSRLVNDLDPTIIERDFDKSKGGSLLSSKKATLWDDYRARWDTHMLPQSGGPIAAFMLHFADYYDGAGGSGT
jgi:type VI secretion system protein ImpI